MKKILIIGSGPSAKEFNSFDYIKNDYTIVAVNNAWRITDEFNYWIHPSDYTDVENKRPEIKQKQKEINHFDYEKIMEYYGGIHQTGYSIMLASSYYILFTEKPNLIGYLGADMNYNQKDKQTHFYGTGIDIKEFGISDPDRMIAAHGNKDPNYLTNIYKRFEYFANQEKCTLVNFSSEKETRLPYQQVIPQNIIE